MKRASGPLLGFLLLAGCAPAPVGVRDVEVPRDAAPQCASLCAHVGLPLDSVVIMANNVGCVCRAIAPAPPPGGAPPPAGTPAPPPAAAPPGGSASAGGMAAIMIAQQAAREAARRQAASNAANRPK